MVVEIIVTAITALVVAAWVLLCSWIGVNK